jgi:hypothetical protein
MANFLYQFIKLGLGKGMCSTQKRYNSPNCTVMHSHITSFALFLLQIAVFSYCLCLFPPIRFLRAKSQDFDHFGSAIKMAKCSSSFSLSPILLLVD